jgi:hypothetical protein
MAQGHHPDIKWIATNKFGSIKIQRGADGLWRSLDGTVWAFADTPVADSVDRCGVGIASLPSSSSLTESCKVHDFMYSSRAWQVFNTRRESDEYLATLISSTPGVASLLAKPFYFLTRVFGRLFWENKKTNN